MISTSKRIVVGAGLALALLAQAAPASAATGDRRSYSRAGYRTVPTQVTSASVLVVVPGDATCPSTQDTHQNVGISSDVRDQYLVPRTYALVDLACVDGVPAPHALLTTGTRGLDLDVSPGDRLRMVVRQSRTELFIAVIDETAHTRIFDTGAPFPDRSFVFGDIQPYAFDVDASYPRVVLRQPTLNGAPLSSLSPKRINLVHHGATVTTSDFDSGGGFALSFQGA